ncbi:MAG TPA: protealysin inhibitor emfourin [Anaerolineae bacterium]
MPRALVIMLFVSWVAACTPGATPLAPTPIDYQRSGGFIGVQDHLTIDLNGHATLTRRTTTTQFDLSRDQLGAIQTALQAAGFVTLTEKPTPQGVADGFAYVITYQGRTLRTGDPSVPKELEAVISTLNRLIDSGGK